MVNYYHILSVSSDASPKVIKDAFKKLAILYHPDKNQGDKKSEEKFKSINEAYQVLNDPSKRGIYDQKLSYFLYNEKFTKTTSKTTHQSYNNPPNQTSPPPFSKSDFKPEDFAAQGKHYEGPFYDHSKRSSLNYVIAFTIAGIIAVGSLLFAFMMNNIAAKEHYKTAVFNVENEDYSKAMRELNEAIHFDDKFGEAYFLRAEVKIKLQYFESALPDYNLAIRYLEPLPQNILQKRDECRKTIENKNSGQ